MELEIPALLLSGSMINLDCLVNIQNDSIRTERGVALQRNLIFVKFMELQAKFESLEFFLW